MKIGTLICSFGLWCINCGAVFFLTLFCLAWGIVEMLFPFGLLAAVALSWVVLVVMFKKTFEDIFVHEGMKKVGRTVFIQGGGIFPVMHAVFLILKAIAYHIYLNVKESYVIPNFSIAQIERAREVYNTVSSVVGGGFILYLIFIPVPLIIAGAISRERIKKTAGIKDEIIGSERN